MPCYRYLILLIFLTMGNLVQSQNISHFQQFNGHYDYLAFGNTLNLSENNSGSPCTILTSSSANFYLSPGQTVKVAYLYWAGSGTGDFEVTLNQIPITATRTFSYNTVSNGNTYEYFSAFADVTQQLKTTGNGVYTLADLDLTAVIPKYCNPPGTSTNFGGWAITVVYEDPSLPLNQVNIFDGMEGVGVMNQTLTINLQNLLVLDRTGAKIGFLAWEGDKDIAVNETLQLNGNILSNPPLNPPNNVFNGTNSFTGSDTLYNMDIDYFPISNYIQVGDTTAEIKITSGQDLVMINNIITVLNTELPDATISFDGVRDHDVCGDGNIKVDYTVYNLNSTAVLPKATPIAFYADSLLVGQAATVAAIPIDGQENNTISLTIPRSIGSHFTLKLVVDDQGNGIGIVDEIDEENNEDESPLHVYFNPIIDDLINLETCDLLDDEYFDLTQATAQIDPNDTLTFHLTQLEAEQDINPIQNPERYHNIQNPQTIFIRVSNPDCYLIASFTITVISCPLPDATVDFPEISACRDRNLWIIFTVYNLDGTGPLPSGTPIYFYGDQILLHTAYTRNSIPMGGNETNSIQLSLPDNLPDTFTLKTVVNIDETGNIFTEELTVENNEFSREVNFLSIAPIPSLPNLMKCDEGFQKAIFDLRVQDELVKTGQDGTVSYFTSHENAIANIDPIESPSDYENLSNPQTIYVRLENEICFSTASFLLETEKCKPFIPQGFSPNGDGINDEFEISNLLDIYFDFELQIYSRNGNLIYVGHNEDRFWDGIPTKGILFKEQLVPVGTYYYRLVLNDPKFPKPFVGWVYINY